MASPSLKPAPSASSRTPVPPREQRPRRRKRGLAVLAVSLLLVYFAPTLVALTPLRDLVLSNVFEGIAGTIHSDGASLGWFSSVEYRGVEIRDREGALLLAAPVINVDRTPLQLLTNRSRIGKVLVQQPELHIIARAEDSNAEEVILPWWNTPSSGPVEMELEVTEGTIAVEEEATRQRWNVSVVEATLELTNDLAVTWSVAGKVEHPGRPGTFTAASVSEHAAIQIKAEQTPLGMFRWLLARKYRDINVSGELSCDFLWQPSTSTGEHSDEAGGSSALLSALRGRMALTDLMLSGGPLQSDELRLKDLRVQSDVEQASERVHVKQLAVECDVGRVTGQGALTFASSNERSTLAVLARDEFTLEGSLDLAHLARMLPKTLRVRPETQITGGMARWKVASQPNAEGHSWQARLETAELAAINAGKPIRWDKPIVIAVAAHETRAGIVFDSLQCNADFCQITGKGTANELTADLAFDLDRLNQQLGPLIDLGEVQLAGEGQAQLRWERDETGTFRVSAAARLKNLLLGATATTAWREESLDAELQASGRSNGMAVEQLDTAVFRMMANGQGRAGDALDVHLRESVGGRAGSQPIVLDRWPVLMHCSGNVAQWRTRLSPWIALAGWDLNGAMDVHANVTWSPGICELHSLRGAVQGLHAWNGEWFIDEPILQLAMAGRYEQPSRRVELTGVSVETSTASVKTDKVSIALPTAGGLGLIGEIAFVADLEKLQRWRVDPKAPAAIAWRGQLGGRALLERSSDTTRAQLDASIDNFAAIDMALAASNGGPGNPLRNTAGGITANRAPAGSEPLWQEKQLTLALRALYSSSDDTVMLDRVQLGSEALKLDALGRIDALGGKAQVNLQGQAEIDWARLSKLLVPYFGNNISVAGRETRKFAVQGPIGGLIRGNNDTKVSFVSAGTASSIGNNSADTFAWLKPVSAQAGIGWQEADVYGLRIGSGDIAGNLRDGVLKIEPIELESNEGRVRVAPQMRLTPVPMELIHGRAKVIERVRVSPEMTASWLKYIAPAVAEAIEADGRLSLDLEGAKVPLQKPESADIAGRLQVHSLQVTPGAPARTFILLAEQIRALVERRPPPIELSRNPTLLTISEQQIDFRMTDGRVHHQGMTMNIGDVTIRTQGWVALDQSINLVAEVPIKAEWIERTPALAGLKDKTLQIPIGGTLRQPRVDPRAMQQVTSLFVENAARGVIENQLNKQLDRLFKPR